MIETQGFFRFKLEIAIRLFCDVEMLTDNLKMSLDSQKLRRYHISLRFFTSMFNKTNFNEFCWFKVYSR